MVQTITAGGCAGPISARPRAYPFAHSAMFKLGAGDRQSAFDLRGEYISHPASPRDTLICKHFLARNFEVLM